MKNADEDMSHWYVCAAHGMSKVHGARSIRIDIIPALYYLSPRRSCESNIASSYWELQGYVNMGRENMAGYSKHRGNRRMGG
jgi:hypothetical protein